MTLAVELLDRDNIILSAQSSVKTLYQQSSEKITSHYELPLPKEKMLIYFLDFPFNMWDLGL